MASNSSNAGNAVSSDFNLQRLTPNEMLQNITATISCAGNIALFGRRGSGKTQISKQAIKDSGTKEVYLNLSVLERVDLGGYPDVLAAVPEKDRLKERFINFILPAFFKDLRNEDKNAPDVTLLLDEVDKADPSLWAPLLEITQFKTINGIPLPRLRSCIMTGNLTAEGGQRPSLPLLDRTEKYLCESDARQWLDWAGRSREIHPSISAYVNDHPDHLYGTVDAGDAYADASPRGWHNASKLLIFGEKHQWPTSVMVQKVLGCVGKQIGFQFRNYYEHYQVLLPLVDKIFKGQVIKDFDKLEPTKQIVAAMIACARLATNIDACAEGKFPESAGVVAKFLLTIESEVALVAARSQIGLERLIAHGMDEEPNWSKLLDKVNDRIG
jgi:hypothetical protein